MNNHISMLLALGGFSYLPDMKCHKTLPEKPCLNCGKMKKHNNAYCSAECCRQYRIRKN
jgi:hypothetical protein